MSPWTVYWITRLDAIQVVALLLMLGLAGASVVCFVCYTNEGEEKFKRLAKRFIFASCVFLLLMGLVPSTKEAIAIYALPKIGNNEKVRQIPENAVDLINEQMEAWLKELRGEKGEKK